MENSIKTTVDNRNRWEVYDHDRIDGYYANGLKLKPISYMTQGQTYEILEEKPAKEVCLGMIYVIKDDDGNKRHISDKYFHPVQNELVFENSKTDWKDVICNKTVKKMIETMPNLVEQRKKVKTDFENINGYGIDKDDSLGMPVLDRSCPPTVKGLKEQFEENIQLNKLAGTYKKKMKEKKQPRSTEETRFQKSSIEIELDLMRAECLGMIDRIDSITNSIEAVRKFA